MSQGIEVGFNKNKSCIEMNVHRECDEPMNCLIKTRVVLKFLIMGRLIFLILRLIKTRVVLKFLRLGFRIYRD